MEPIFTELGLQLSTNGVGHEFSDFYYQLFGYAPTAEQCETAKGNLEQLKELITLVKNGDKIYEFFNLGQKYPLTPYTYADYLDVKEALCELRNNYAQGICIAYGQDSGMSMFDLYRNVKRLENCLKAYNQQEAEYELLLGRPIEYLRLPENVIGTLQKANIYTIYDLLAHTIEEISALPGINYLNFIKVTTALARFNLFLPAPRKE